jgi:GNAT superfamily N-acetyltransferase
MQRPFFVAMASKIRPALPSEDELCSRILTNAFLPIWNHNWFQNISKPLAPVPLNQIQSPEPLTPLQAARTRFYLSLIKSTRLLGGEVFVNVVEGEAEESNRIGAILLWLPRQARMTITSVSIIYRSGFLRTMYEYGLTGIHRISTVFEGNIATMFKAAGVDEVEFSFVQMLAVNPVFKGRGLGAQLLRWRVERCEGQGGVVMDTSTMQAVRVYQKMGFKVLGEKEVKTGCDGVGIRLQKGKQEDVRHVQMVMMLREGEYIPA